jgi:hypothetical protein
VVLVSEVETRLAEIRERVGQATPPPWKWDRPETLENPETYQTVYEATHDHGCACRKDCTIDVELSIADAEFIANARQDIPWLLDQLARVRTDTIEQCAKAAKEAAHDPVVPPYTHGAAWIQGFITGAQRIVAAVRGVSHEH